MRCAFCGGAAHPATGCQYGPRTLSCYRCTVAFWVWLERWTHARPSRRHRVPADFYAAAGKWHGKCKGGEHGKTDAY
jgi:hypothetical protein